MIEQNISLKPYNTFGMDVQAKYYSSFNDQASMEEGLAFAIKRELPLLILGGGSNVLFTKDFEGIVLRNGLSGRELISEDEESAVVKGGAGENWHQFVLWCIASGFSGIENLSLIPGSLGAGPMQNIGAYGVELCEHFHSLQAYHIQEKEVHTFNLAECGFGYRESVFKRKLKNQYVIVSVNLKLNKKPNFRTTYGAIEQELEKMGITELSVQAVSDAVVNIRRSKLPDPAQIGNAGSFFKNPVIALSHFDELKLRYPDIVSYPAGENMVKVPAGWLIEKSGWKGKTIGNYGVHKLQALVLVNYGGAKGQEILNLSTEIIEDISNKFGILLEREVNIY
jgi:UDP-N-acetylmuramate dehydrogenase